MKKGSEMLGGYGEAVGQYGFDLEAANTETGAKGHDDAFSIKCE